MSIEFTIRKGSTNPTSGSGITLGEPAFNYSNNTLWIGKGHGVTAAWVGAGICGASGGIAAGLTYQIPTLGAVKDYFTAVSSNFLGTTAAYVASFNGITGAVTGITAGGANTFTALNSFSSGISAAGGVTFSGTFSGATASFSNLLSASAGVSASALTVSTTGTTHKTSSITMASGVTASISVASQIILNAYDADSGNIPPVPYTRTGYIMANSDNDLKLQGVGDSYISILDNTISIGDVDGANNFAKITFDTTEYVAVTGKLAPDQLVWETEGLITIPHDPSGHPIYIRHSDGDDPLNDNYPFYVSLGGVVQAANVTTYAVTTPYLYADSLFATSGGGGTVYINSDYDGGGGGNSITHIGDLAGDNNNTFITVDDSAGNITVSAPNGTVALSGVVTVNSQVVSTNARGWFL